MLINLMKKEENIKKVCDIWSEILNEEISPNDNLLERGLDSLKATKFISILNQKYAINIKLKSIFLHIIPRNFVEECLANTELNDDNIFEGEI